MTTIQIVVSVIIVTGSFYVGALAYAACVAKYKRELYIVKILIVGYFVTMGIVYLTDHSFVVLRRFFLPALAALFLTQAISTLIDARKRLI